MNIFSNLKVFSLFLISILIFTASSLFCFASERIRVDKDLEIELLEDGLWRHISYHQVEDFGRSPANGLIVVSNGLAAVIDTPWTDEQTRLLFTWISKELNAAVESVICTHSHIDCMGGLAAAHQAGAASYAHRLTLAFARQKGGPVPQTGFNDYLDLSIGPRKMRLRYLGPGHTADNIVVWIPDSRILFGGCLVRSAGARSMGFTGEADLKHWPVAIRLLLDEFGDAHLIVPGHGQPGGRDLPDRTLELLAEMGCR